MIPSPFQELQLSLPLLRVLEEIGYETPSPIQAAAIPPLLEGKDLVGQAQTGTGKTAAFALPLLSNLPLERATPRILVLTPTRELTIQVAEAFQTYARYLKGFHVLPIYGGQEIGLQLRHLKRGAHVIVGTPGRVMDHLRRKSLDLSELTTIVLDEADEMLRMGFFEDVEWILDHTPSERQTALFSATMPEPIRRAAQKHLNDPVEVKIKSSVGVAKGIDQYYWQVKDIHKLDALTRLLDTEDFDACIIFVRTKNTTLELAEKLEARGHFSVALNGDISQNRREKVIEQLKSGDIDIVIATDVAARGLDVQRITHVINYDIPGDTESYIHRIGRTGRAGRSGKAILFASPRESRMLRIIEKATGQKIPLFKIPTFAEAVEKKENRLKQKLLEIIEGQDLSAQNNFVEKIVGEGEISADQIAAALVFELQSSRKSLAFGKKGVDLSEPTRDEKKKERKRERERTQKNEIPLERFRIEVGSLHGATPAEIVGAIANEAGIEGKNICKIKIFPEHSTLYLPVGMPREIFLHLKKTRVRQVPLQIIRDSGHAKERASKTPNKKKKKKK